MKVGPNVQIHAHLTPLPIPVKDFAAKLLSNGKGKHHTDMLRSR